VTKLWGKLKDLLAYEPAVLAWAVNGGVAATLAFVFNLGPDQTAAVTTVTTALAALVTAIKARPVSVSLVTGGLVTIAEAASAFGLHLPAAVLAAVTAVASALLGLMFRQNLTPAVKLSEKRVA
jgi:hypothetical protein